MADLSDFVKPVPAEAVVVEKPAAKKRKKEGPSCGDPEMAEMRKRAKSYCQSFEQYNSIRRYSKKRLQDWIEQKEFDIDSSLKNSVFSFVTEAYAFVLDKLLKADGHVAEQVKNDLSLRQALEDQGRDLLMYLSNKSKILVLTGADIYHGKSEQRRIQQAKRNKEILSVSEGPEDMQASAPTVPGDSEGQKSPNFGGRPKREREDSTDCEATEVPASMEGGVRPDYHHESDVYAAADLGDDEPGGSDSLPRVLDDGPPAADGATDGGQVEEDTVDPG